MYRARSLCCLIFSVLALPLHAQAFQPSPALQQALQHLRAPAPTLQRGVKRHPKLSEALQAYLAQHPNNGQRLALRIEHVVRGTAALRAAVHALGGETQAVHNTQLYISLDSDRLYALLAHPAQPFIRQITLQATLQQQSLPALAPTSAPVLPTQQGAQKIGILDFSFSGYETLQARGELPAPTAHKDFSEQQTQTLYDNRVLGHGTLCARLIHQFAPHAQLLIATLGPQAQANEGQALAAANWLQQQGATIINVSAAAYNTPLDGSAALDQLANQHARRQPPTQWIVAAGNQAHLHWQGPVQDKNHDGWLDSGPAGERRPLADLFAITLQQAGPVSITLNWGSWHAPAADLDLFLYQLDAAQNPQLIARAETLQSAQHRRPLEQLNATLTAGTYLIGIRHTRASTSPASVHLFVQGASALTPSVANGSTGSPGTATQAITVGALQEGTRTQSAYYSGRSSTKPELLAPVLKSFQGSSAAAAIVSGLAGTQISASRQTLLTYLNKRLEQVIEVNEAR